MIPSDLISIADAIKKTGRSRTWIEQRVTVYTSERKDKVSESAVMAALAEWKEPKLKDKKED